MGNKKVKKSPSFQFYSGDWLRDPALRACSPSTRGTWIDMICFMDQSIKRGFFLAGNQIPTDEIAARMLGLSLEEYSVTKAELVQFNVCSLDENGAIFSRRMLKDEKERKAWRKRQSFHRSNKDDVNQDLTDYRCHGLVTTNVTPKSRSSSSSSSSSILKPPLPPKRGGGDSDLFFEKFWKAYPKKASMGQAERAWRKLSPNEQLVETILQAIERAKTSENWRKDGGQFIPYPATWLNAKGWKDENYQPVVTLGSWSVDLDAEMRKREEDVLQNGTA